MYRINLYREYSEKRSRALWQRLWTGAFTVLVGVEALFVVSLIIGSFLLSEQVRGLRAEVARLDDAVASESQPPPEFALAERLMALRQGRVLWYPKLASISCQIEPSLVLLDLTGQAATSGREPRLELNGVVRGGGSPIESLSRFTTALRNDPAIVEDFPEVTLNIVEGEESGRFKVVCQAPRTEQ